MAIEKVAPLDLSFVFKYQLWLFFHVMKSLLIFRHLVLWHHKILHRPVRKGSIWDSWLKRIGIVAHHLMMKVLWIVLELGLPRSERILPLQRVLVSVRRNDVSLGNLVFHSC